MMEVLAPFGRKYYHFCGEDATCNAVIKGFLPNGGSIGYCPACATDLRYEKVEPGAPCDNTSTRLVYV